MISSPDSDSPPPSSSSMTPAGCPGRGCRLLRAEARSVLGSLQVRMIFDVDMQILSFGERDVLSVLTRSGAPAS